MKMVSPVSPRVIQVQIDDPLIQGIFKEINREIDAGRPGESRKSHDLLVIQKEAKEVISGFLNLGAQEGWQDYQHDVRVGAAFVRCMLFSYYSPETRPRSFSIDEVSVLERVLEGLKNVGQMYPTLFCFEQPADGHRPKTSRVSYDEGVTGWGKHAVCRLVGNVASTYNRDMPFFEVLVNSIQITADTPLCRPFHVAIFDDEVQLDKRRRELAEQHFSCAELGHSVFYSSALRSPEVYLKGTKRRIGPNAKRILEGLTFLNEVSLMSQKTENCWIKQPMRCLLASLYLEIFSVKTALTPKEAWREALDAYKEMQKKSGIPLIEELISYVALTPEEKAGAEQEIARRLTL